MEKNKIKKIAVTLSLAAVIGLGGTLAYINNVTDTVTNTFNSSKDTQIDGKIEETEWDETGKQKAENYQPGDVIAKNPVVSLETKSESAWVAMSLDYKNSKEESIDYETFKKYAEHDGIGSDWVLIAKNAEGSDLYANMKELTAGNKTQPIFNQITVNAGITTVKDITKTDHYKLVTKTDENGKVTRTLTKVEGPAEIGVTYYDADGNVIGEGTDGNITKLPKFEIGVKAYAIQTQNIDAQLAKRELIKLANEGVTDKSKLYVGFER